MSALMRMAVVAVLILSGCARQPNPVREKGAESSKPTAPVTQGATEKPRQQGELFQLSDGTTARFYGEADVRGKDSFRIEMGSASPGIYYFSPTVLIGSPGQRLSLEIFNADQEGHPFQVKGQGEGIRSVAPGEAETVTATFPAAGAVTFSCPHEGHAGELRVG